MAVLSAILGATAAIATAVGTATSLKAAHDQKKATRAAQAEAQKTPVYNEKKEMTKAANQEANANAKRVMAETDTVKTSALGNTGTTEVKKKTLLGG